MLLQDSHEFHKKKFGLAVWPAIANIYTNKYIYMFVSMYVYIYMFVCMYVYIYMFVSMYVYIYMFVCMYVYIYMWPNGGT